MDRTVQLLKALAEPTRLRIVALCRGGGDLVVSEFVRILGQSQPRVSRHLRLLTDAGALDRIPEGSWVFYRLSQNSVAQKIIDAALADIPSNDTTLARDRDRLAAVKNERAESADAYFSANAHKWGELRALHIDQGEVNAAIQSLINEQNGGRFLDIGTGTGEMLHTFAAHFEHCEGIDLSHDMLNVARASLEAGGFSNCHVRHGDLYSLPYEENSFDMILIHQVLHYVDDVAGAIQEAARLLRPGGQLFIADFAPHDVEELRESHQHRRLGFADEDLSAILQGLALTVTNVIHLKGEPLTVSIWHSERAQQ